MRIIFLIFLFFSLSAISTGQNLNPCVEGILHGHYKDALENKGDYNEYILKYQSASKQLNMYKNKIDSLIKVIHMSDFSDSEKSSFGEIMHLINNDTIDLYFRVRVLNQNAVLKLNSLISMSYLYELERNYVRLEISENIEKCKKWAVNLCRFSLNAINYYNSDNKRVPDSIFKKEIALYNFKKGDIIADIGAGSGYFEKAISKYANDLTVYVNDIDSIKQTQLEA